MRHFLRHHGLTTLIAVALAVWCLRMPLRSLPAWLARPVADVPVPAVLDEPVVLDVNGKSLAEFAELLRTQFHLPVTIIEPETIVNNEIRLLPGKRTLRTQILLALNSIGHELDFTVRQGEVLIANLSKPLLNETSFLESRIYPRPTTNREIEELDERLREAHLEGASPADSILNFLTPRGFFRFQKSVVRTPTGCLFSMPAEQHSRRQQLAKILERAEEPRLPNIEPITIEVGVAGTYEKLQAVLDRRLSFDFRDEPLSEVVERLQKVFELPLVVDDRAVSTSTGRLEPTINLRLTDVSLRTALAALQIHCGVAWCLMGDAILLTSPLRAKELSFLRLYPWDDLLESHQPEERQRLAELIGQKVACLIGYDPFSEIWNDQLAPSRHFLVASCSAAKHHAIENFLAEIRSLQAARRAAVGGSAVPPLRKSVANQMAEPIFQEFKQTPVREILKAVLDERQINYVFWCQDGTVAMNDILNRFVDFAPKNQPLRFALDALFEPFGCVVAVHDDFLEIMPTRRLQEDPWCLVDLRSLTDAAGQPLTKIVVSKLAKTLIDFEYERDRSFQDWNDFVLLPISRAGQRQMVQRVARWAERWEQADSLRPVELGKAVAVGYQTPYTVQTKLFPVPDLWSITSDSEQQSNLAVILSQKLGHGRGRVEDRLTVDLIWDTLVVTGLPEHLPRVERFLTVLRETLAKSERDEIDPPSYNAELLPLLESNVARTSTSLRIYPVADLLRRELTQPKPHEAVAAKNFLDPVEPLTSLIDFRDKSQKKRDRLPTFDVPLLNFLAVFLYDKFKVPGPVQLGSVLVANLNDAAHDELTRLLAVLRGQTPNHEAPRDGINQADSQVVNGGKVAGQTRNVVRQLHDCRAMFAAWPELTIELFCELVDEIVMTADWHLNRDDDPFEMTFVRWRNVALHGFDKFVSAHLTVDEQRTLAELIRLLSHGDGTGTFALPRMIELEKLDPRQANERLLASVIQADAPFLARRYAAALLRRRHLNRDQAQQLQKFLAATTVGDDSVLRLQVAELLSRSPRADELRPVLEHLFLTTRHAAHRVAVGKLLVELSDSENSTKALLAFRKRCDPKMSLALLPAMRLRKQAFVVELWEQFLDSPLDESLWTFLNDMDGNGKVAFEMWKSWSKDSNPDQRKRADRLRSIVRPRFPLLFRDAPEVSNDDPFQ